MKKFKNFEELKEFEYEFNETYCEENNLTFVDYILESINNADELNKKFAKRLEELGYNLDDLLETDEYYNVDGHKNPRCPNLIIGAYYRNEDIKIARINGRFYTLEGWDGEKYNDCRNVRDCKGSDYLDCGRHYIVKPIKNDNVVDFKTEYYDY